ncbi:hypothetical protein ACFL3D_05375 [Candidatus Omnitrophota bacterium]
MFLNDINRKINKQRGGWERWDDHRYLELKEYQTIVDFIGDISLLCVRNLGENTITVEIKGLHTHLAAGEEKYFNDCAGRQVIFHTKEAGGKVFVGQSLRGDISSLKIIAFICILLVSAGFLYGCVNTGEFGTRKKQVFATPTAPVATPIPRTPRV